MRKSFNVLAAKVKTALKDDLLSGHVFIFRGRSGNQLKLEVAEMAISYT